MESFFWPGPIRAATHLYVNRVLNMAMGDNLPDMERAAMTEATIYDGIVVSVETGRAIVRIRRDEDDCGGCSSCAVKGLCHGRDAGNMDLPVAVGNAADLSPGDSVRIAYRGTNAAVAAFVMFLPALLGVLLGGFAANLLVGDGDGVFLFGVAVGLGLGLLVTFVLARCFAFLKPDVHLVDRGFSTGAPLAPPA